MLDSDKLIESLFDNAKISRIETKDSFDEMVLENYQRRKSSESKAKVYMVYGTMIILAALSLITSIYTLSDSSDEISYEKYRTAYIEKLADVYSMDSRLY